jgi:hypothetical protein
MNNNPSLLPRDIQLVSALLQNPEEHWGHWGFQDPCSNLREME